MIFMNLLIIQILSTQKFALKQMLHIITVAINYYFLFLLNKLAEAGIPFA